jgi:hypothetical protein
MPKFFFRKKKTVFDGLLLAKPVIVVEDDTTSTAAVVVREFTPSFSDWRKIFYVPLDSMSLVVVVSFLLTFPFRSSSSSRRRRFGKEVYVGSFHERRCFDTRSSGIRPRIESFLERSFRLWKRRLPIHSSGDSKRERVVDDVVVQR